MAQHLILAAGLLAHLVLLAVLFRGGAARRLSLFAALIAYDVLRALALAFAFGHLPRQSQLIAGAVFDWLDLLLEWGALGQLVWIALRRLNGFRRFTLPLLLLASGAVVVSHLAPVHHYNSRVTPLLLHFLLGVLMFEWAIVLAFLLRAIGLSWRDEAVAISFGFGVYAAALLFGGGYFRVGREMSDYIFFSYFRIAVYLVVVLWWIVMLASSARKTIKSRFAGDHARAILR